MSAATFGRRPEGGKRPQTVERARTTWRTPSDGASQSRAAPSPASVQAKPVQARPVQARPAQAPPVQARPVQAAAPAPLSGLSADAQDFLATGKPPSWVTTTRGGLIAAILFFGAILTAMTYGYGSGIVRDWRLSGTWRPALDVKVGEARCKRYWFVVTTCDVSYNWTERGVTRTASSSFMLGLTSTHGAPVIPVRSARDASAVTALSAVTDWLTNRVITLLVFAVLLGLVVLTAVRGLLAGRYKDGAAYRDLVSELRAIGAALQAKEAA